MKIRNGFVSNSSSSSFIMSYDKSKVLTDPKDIVELLKKDYKNILMRGWDLGEGDDIFEISEEQASLIRKFPNEFIKRNSGTFKKDVYFYDDDCQDYKKCGVEEIPIVSVYPDAVLTPDAYEYTNPKVDMSDFNSAKELSNEWLQERDRRCKKIISDYRVNAIKEAKQNLINSGVSEENSVAEFISISNRSCDDDFYGTEDDFVYRYFTSEDNFFDQSSFKMTKAKNMVYGVIYKEAYQDKNTIIDKIMNDKETTYGISRCNPILNTIHNLENINIYLLGQEEKELLIKKKDEFLNSDLEYVLFDSPRVIKNGDTILNLSGEVILGNGYFYIGNPGENVIDFKKEIITGKISNTYLKCNYNLIEE